MTFHQLDYFWRLIMIFWKGEAAQSNVNILKKVEYKKPPTMEPSFNKLIKPF